MSLDDLAAFATVAEVKSFTRAAAQLGISPSALSQTIRRLEARLGFRLLARTTRSVGLTPGGARLFAVLRPRLDEIAAEIGALQGASDQPSGHLRITTSEHAALHLLEPALARLMAAHPITVEVSVDMGLTDIVAEGFDAGIRLGEQLDQDMIAVPISPTLRMVVVGAPGYLQAHPAPVVPADLHDHRCIALRLPRLGNLAPWEFAKEGRAVNVRVPATFAHNSPALGLAAALDGIGLAWLPETVALPLIAQGRLIAVLEDWSPRFPGFHLYYPARAEPSSALAALVAALRWKAPG